MIKINILPKASLVRTVKESAWIKWKYFFLGLSGFTLFEALLQADNSFVKTPGLHTVAGSIFLVISIIITIHIMRRYN